MLTVIATVLAFAAMLFGQPCTTGQNCKNSLTVAEIQQAWGAERAGGGGEPAPSDER